MKLSESDLVVFSYVYVICSARSFHSCDFISLNNFYRFVHFFSFPPGTAAPALLFSLCFYFIRRYEEDFSFRPFEDLFLFLFASSFVESSCVLNFYEFNSFLCSSCYLKYNPAFINSLSDFKSFPFVTAFLSVCLFFIPFR